MTIKNFKGILVCDWRNGTMRITKKKKKSYGPYEMPISIDIDVELPEKVDAVIKGRIEVSVARAKNMILESI